MEISITPAAMQAATEPQVYSYITIIALLHDFSAISLWNTMEARFYVGEHVLAADLLVTCI